MIELMRQPWCTITSVALMEAASLAKVQYGTVDVLTTPEDGRPREDTNPLMMYCKAELKGILPRERRDVLRHLLDGNSDIRLVDGRGANAIMMAASQANGDAFDHFYHAAHHLRSIGFNFNFRNIDARNILNLNPVAGGAKTIKRKCQDLARRDFIDPRGPDVAHGGKGKSKGQSSSNARQGGPPPEGSSRWIHPGHGYGLHVCVARDAGGASPN